MTRRRFAFWLGICLFWIAEKTRAQALDDLAAAIMHGTEPVNRSIDERWQPNENRTWRWYERETLKNGVWRTTGITTPIHKVTGEPYTGRTGYLDEALVPVDVRRRQEKLAKSDPPRKEEPGDGQPSEERRAREGRPPSKWLRSLHAGEIRVWLKTIDVPPVGVSGMTFHTHLTRDHSFSAEKIEGLTVAEQAKLHSAAHYGY